MTYKPPRLILERVEKEERIRFLKREQQEREARRSLQDFLRHQREDDDDHLDRDYHVTTD